MATMHGLDPRKKKRRTSISVDTPPPPPRETPRPARLQQFFDRTCNVRPQALALVCGDERLTYAALDQRVTDLAWGLIHRGVRTGDRVGLLMERSVHTYVSLLAVLRAGAAFVPLDPSFPPERIAFIAEDAGLALLATTSDFRPAVAAVGCPVLFLDAPGSVAETTSGRLRDPARQGLDDALCYILYTSGTTGRPKGVMLTHANLAWKNLAHIVEFGFTEADLGLACGPLYHVGALDLTTTSLLAAGATVIVHRVFDAAAVVDELERSRVTTVWLAPAMVNAIMALPDVEARDLSSVRVIINGGEKMPIPLIERIGRTFPSAWFADAYGLTETVSGDTFLDRDSIVTKLGSVGRACLHLEVQVWDDEGRPVAAGERGEIVLRGPKVFKGYWRDPEATERAFAGGWFHTGDIGVLDEDGYLFIVDRLKDMIVSGGENIAGSEVERVLYEHAAVLEVAVVGRPDERWGEVPVAFVVLREGQVVTADELVAQCRDQLAKFKVPKDVTFLDALPRNPSGKVLKRNLRTQG
jgi:amino acid adenylation domain-containing protein